LSELLIDIDEPLIVEKPKKSKSKLTPKSKTKKKPKQTFLEKKAHLDDLLDDYTDSTKRKQIEIATGYKIPEPIQLSPEDLKYIIWCFRILYKNKMLIKPEPNETNLRETQKRYLSFKKLLDLIQ